MADLSIKLLADIKDAVKGVEQFASDAKSSIGSVSKSFEGMGTAIKLAVAGFVTGKLVSGIEEVIHAASESEVAINDLSNSLKIAGNFSEEAVAGLEDFAKQLQATTKFEDDAIIKNIAYLESLTGVSDQGLKVLARVAADFSAGTGKDLNTSFEILAKAAGGNVTALQKLGISIRKGATDAETLANTVQSLNEKFGGRAVAQTNTFSGAVAQLSNQFADFKEELGKIIITNEDLTESLKTISSGLSGVSKFVKENESTFKGLVSVVGQAMVGAFDLFKIAVLAVVHPIESLKILLLELKTTAILVFGNIVEALGRVFSILPGVNAFEDFTNQIFGLADASQAVIDTSLNSYFGDTNKSTKEATSSTKDLNKELNKIDANIFKTGKKEIGLFADEIKRLENSLKNAGLSPIEAIVNTLKAEEKLLKDALANQDIDRKKFNELRTKLEISTAIKIADEQKKIYEKAFKEEEDARKKMFERVSALSSGNVEQINKELSLNGGLSGALDIGSISGSIVKAVTNGAQGAVSAISGIVTIAATAFLGPIGQVVGQVFEILAQSPDKLREQIKAFFDAIPVIIQNVVANIPNILISIFNGLKSLVLKVFSGDFIPTLITTFLNAALQFAFQVTAEIPYIINELIRNIPKIVAGLSSAITNFAILLSEQAPILIESLVQSLPILIESLAILMQSEPLIISLSTAFFKAALVLIPLFQKLPLIFANEMIKQAPSIAAAFANSLIRDGVPAIAGAISDQIKQLNPVNRLIKTDQNNGGGGGGGSAPAPSTGASVSGLINSIFGTNFSFAEGGLVPGGFPNDSFPARLTSGELVIDRSISGRLQNYLDSQESGSSDNVMMQLLASIDSKIGMGSINLQIGDRVLTTTIREAIKSGRVVFS